MNPPPYAPLNYEVPQPNRRPKSVTVLAVLGIIFGGFGTLCTPAALVPYFMQVGPPNPVVDAVRNNQGLFAWVVATTIVGFFMAIFLLVNSIGSLNLKPWARRGMVIYGWIATVMGIVGMAINAVWMLPIVTHAQQNAGAQQAGVISGYVGGLIGGLLGLIYPIYVIVYMKKTHVMSAFGETHSDPAA